MSVNKKYKVALSKFEALSRWIDDPFKIFLGWHINGVFAPKYYERIDAVFKQKLPKVKRVNRAYIEETYPEIAAEIKEDIQKQVDRYLVLSVRKYKILNDWLNQNAPNVELKAERQIVYTSNAGTYSTQTSPLTYTHSSCKTQADLIKSCGIECEIVPLYYHKSLSILTKEDLDKQSQEIKDSAIRGGCEGHAVIAPLEPFMLDAIRRKTKMTKLEWAVNCWKNGSNPKVIDPFLDDGIFDESLKVWRNNQ